MRAPVPQENRKVCGEPDYGKDDGAKQGQDEWDDFGNPERALAVRQCC